MSDDIPQVPSNTEQRAREVTPKAIRGFGAPYQRGRIWWIRYHHRGQEYRESAGSERRLDAERLLKARWKQIGRGKFIGPREEKVLVNDLLDALVRHYEQNGWRSIDTLRGRMEPLRAAFGTCRAVDVTGAAIEEYKSDRLTKLLAEHNVREGFVEPSTFDEIVKHLPAPIDDVARFGFISGWRKQEILSLQWSDVDLENRRVRLRRENSKNEEPRVIVLTGEL